MHDIDDLKKKAVRASKWSILSEITSRSISPVLFIILARMLSPVDYGIFSAAVLVVTFAQIFADFGLSRALIQTTGPLQKASNVVFWLNAGLGTVTFAVLFLTADEVAALFQSGGVAPVIRLLSIQVLLCSLCAVQTALYQRELNFRILFWIRLATTTIPAFISIPFALMGYGYWALAFGAVAASVLQPIILWRICAWRPGFDQERAETKRLLAFAAWVTGGGVLAWFHAWADSLIIGVFLTAHYLGLYQAGNTLVTMIFASILSPVMPVLFSALSKLQDQTEHMQQSLTGTIKLLTAVALPAGVGLLAVREPLERALMGSNWLGTGGVIGILAMAQCISWILFPCNEAYRAIGRPDLELRINLIAILFYLPAYLLSVQESFAAFLAVRLGMTCCVGVPLQLLYAGRYLGIKKLQLVKMVWRLFLAAFVMFMAVFLVERETAAAWQDPYLQLLLLMALGVSVYTGVLYCVDRGVLHALWRLVRH